MNLLNLYFTPYAAGLVIVAIYFSEPAPSIRWSAFGILAVSLGVNHWLSRNTYRFVGWTARIHFLQIWLTFLWSALLFWLLVPYWAPMWLLLTMPPVTAAMYQTRLQTLATGCASGAMILFMYWLRSRAAGFPLGAQLWGQAFVHATFIPVMALFVHALAQTALQMRDIRSRL